MYYEINKETPEQSKPVDDSSIRDFSYINYQEPHPEHILINADSMVKESQWVKKYEPNRFVDLLTDEKSNRELLAWLKSWDPIVFNKNHHKKIEPISAFISPRKSFKYRNQKQQ